MDTKSQIEHQSILNKYPSYRDESIKGYWLWLKGRRRDDNAEGYWRIHDKLYDLQDFIKFHPGGREWIEMSKGTDITEAFETHHLTPTAAALKDKFYIKDADAPRNYNLTYDENGFYKVIKRRVIVKLPSLDHHVVETSKRVSDAIIIGFFILSILAVRSDWIYSKIFFVLLASQFGAWIIPTSHNFNHQRDNWRRFNANFVLMGWRSWRCSHVFSHHMYTNSYADMEISSFEPFIRLIPVQKRSLWNTIISYITLPIVFGLVFHGSWIFRYLGIFYDKHHKLYLDEFLTVVPLISMFIFGNPEFSTSNFLTIFITWNIIIFVSSMIFTAVSTSGSHHGPTIVHEGDDLKSLDFGIYQMITTYDRIRANKNNTLGILYFGDHVLHHLFPTLDQALLPQLRGILRETCKEFGVEYLVWGSVRSVVELFEQMSRTRAVKFTDSTSNDSK